MVLGEVANEVVAARTGYITAAALVPTWISQAVLSGLFIFSYLNARKPEIQGQL